MEFKDWLSSRVELFIQYRYQLSVITRTVQEYCTDNVCEQRHIDVAIQLLRDVPQPTLGRYPDEATEEDKTYYSLNTPIPTKQWLDIAEVEVRKLKINNMGK